MRFEGNLVSEWRENGGMREMRGNEENECVEGGSGWGKGRRGKSNIER